MTKILIIEDDAIAATIYRNAFAMDGFEVAVARDGIEGIEAFEKNPPQVVLLDLMLPKLDGVEVLKRIRASAGAGNIPVVVLSNSYVPAMVERAWKAGATQCVMKANCTPRKLLEIVKGASVHAPVSQSDQPVPAQAAPPRPSLHPLLSPEADAAFQVDIRKTFFQRIPSTLQGLRGAIHGLAQGSSQDTGGRLFELERKVHGLAGNAGLVGYLEVAHFCSAFAALIHELHAEPAKINRSALRTVAQSVDFLGVLLPQAGEVLPERRSAAVVLVVDDEEISGLTVGYALEKAALRSEWIGNPMEALERARQTAFQLLILDVDMPGMNGLELCRKLRALPAYANTPAVFVTGKLDFETRTQSTLSGGNDFILKPFLLLELTVKALTFILRSQLPRSAQGTEAYGRFSPANHARVTNAPPKCAR